MIVRPRRREQNENRRRGGPASPPLLGGSYQEPPDLERTYGPSLRKQSFFSFEGGGRCQRSSTDTPEWQDLEVEAAFRRSGLGEAGKAERMHVDRGLLFEGELARQQTADWAESETVAAESGRDHQSAGA